MRKEKVTVQSAPFVKPHCVLIVAAATVLLINGRSPHTDVRSQNMQACFLLHVHCMAELLRNITGKEYA